MNKINKVKKLIDFRLSPAEIIQHRLLKHASTRQAFAGMVKLDSVDAQDLFDRIHVCFEEANNDRPYHDWYHTCCVIEGTIRGLRYHLKADLDGLSEAQQSEVNSVVIAAAFHDAGHTGVKDPDIVNVSRSIIIASRFLTERGTLGTNGDSVNVDLPLALETLQSTQYPFKREPLNEYQAIVRDADLLQILEPTWFEDIYCNMYQEFLEGNPTLDFEEFCKNELAFINNAKFYSAWFHDKIQDEFFNVALSRVQQTSVAVSKH